LAGGAAGRIAERHQQFRMTAAVTLAGQPVPLIGQVEGVQPATADPAIPMTESLWIGAWCGRAPGRWTTVDRSPLRSERFESGQVGTGGQRGAHV